MFFYEILCSDYSHEGLKTFKNTLQILKLAYEFRHELFDDFVLARQNAFVTTLFDIIETQSPYFWAISDATTGDFMGFAYFYGIVQKFSGVEEIFSAYITTCFRRKYWGNTVRACAKDFIFRMVNKYKIKKLKAECFSSNRFAARLLKEIGFEVEGKFKNETLVNGKIVDMKAFALHTSRFYHL